MKLLPYFRRIEGREGEERRASFLVLVCSISIGHIFLNAGFWDKICSFSGVSASWPLALFIYSIVYLGVTVYIPEILGGGNVCPFKAGATVGADRCLLLFKCRVREFSSLERGPLPPGPVLMTLTPVKVKGDN